MLRFRSCLLASLLLIIVGTVPASANFTITIGSAVLAPGGSATVDVTIAATPGTALTTLEEFGFTLRITPTNGTQTQLGFTTAQPQPYGDSHYVFGSDSFNASDSPPDNLGTVSTSRTGTPNDTYTGGDFTLSGAAVPVTSSNNLLLRFTVAGISSALPRIGDSFQVALVDPSSTTGGSGSSPTYFSDGTNDIPYTSNVGTISVVPEPTSALLLVLGGAPVGLMVARRRARLGHA